MSYLVLARKYRPRQFAELVGQTHVAATLANAFKQDKLGQAYLFTGTRGVGKTSAARILAKALRCESPDSALGGKNRGNSCDKCSSCEEINKGTSLDVLEIDGASNNGVDSVREIRENVKFLPSRGNVKVYIIDEVHMLTGAAFNALLKTLEEPPPHVIFILATTEVQKIPATILSRCQRFDFRRVPPAVIFDFLGRIMQQEKIPAEPDALKIIARKAEGSMRDALSTLDQALALSGTNLTTAKVTEALGLVGGSFLAQIIDHTVNNRPLEALGLVQKAFDSGVEMKLLATDLAESLRNALLVQMNAESALLDISEEEKRELGAAVRSASPELLQAAFRLLSLGLDEISRSPMPKASLEMTLLRIAGVGRLRTLAQSLPSGASASLPVYSTPVKATAPLHSSAPAATAPAAAPPAAALSVDWPGFVSLVGNEKPALAAILEHAHPQHPPTNWGETGLTIQFRESQGFYAKQAQMKANVDVLEKIASRVVGKKALLRVEVLPDKIAVTPTLAEKEQKNQATQNASLKEAFLQQDIIRDAQEVLGAKLTGFDINQTKK